jgi:anti-sigma factor RsiW
MRCEDLLQRLAEYADGALPKELCGELESHIRDCPPCAELDHDLQDLQRMCRESPSPCLPEETRRRILNLLRQAGAK